MSQTIVALTALSLSLTGCTPDSGNTHQITWSASPSSPKSARCTELISHPCPLITYAHSLTLEDGKAIWADFDGGADNNGVQASAKPPIEELAPEGRFDDRGDDGGLRHAFVLAPQVEVTWTLFNVPGNTTFILTEQ